MSMFLNSQTLETTSTRYLFRLNPAHTVRNAESPARSWEARFKCSLHVVRNEIRIQVNRNCRFAGKSFDQVWSNTGHLVGKSVLTALIPTTVNIKVAQLCTDRIVNMLSAALKLPDSYNKLLIRASAEYCLRVVRKLREDLTEHQKLLTEIRKFTLQEQDLMSRAVTLEDISEFALLDLQAFEDKFLRIQEEADRLGISRRLSDIPVAELVDQ